MNPCLLVHSLQILLWFKFFLEQLHKKRLRIFIIIEDSINKLQELRIAQKGRAEKYESWKIVMLIRAFLKGTWHLQLFADAYVCLPLYDAKWVLFSRLFGYHKLLSCPSQPDRS